MVGLLRQKTTMYKVYMMAVADKSNPAECSVVDYGVPVRVQKFFPKGLQPMVDKLQVKVLKFGVHLLRGIPRFAV